MKRIIPVLVALAAVSAVGWLSVRSSQNPHGKLEWECEACHTPESWTELRQEMAFDHDKTGFKLSGAHRSAQCIGCHKSLVFNQVGTACLDCHTDHHRGQLGAACQNCHTSQDWSGRKDLIDLHAQRGFPLSGVHAIADCESCHRDHYRQEYAGTPVDCQGCHAESFVTASNPDHLAAGFSQNCEQCHAAALGGWENSSFVHPAVFQLTGAHQRADCISCHSSGFAGTSSACYDCHTTDFAAATDPNHVQSGFGQECAVCHSTQAWEPATFNHSATAFPLTGQHSTLDCQACHNSGYTGTPSTCYACHQSAFDGTTDPNHNTAGFSAECQTCHSTQAWTPSSFNHSVTAFPLTGKHTTLACVACHSSGYTGTPSTCYACHQTAYDDATTNPSHAAANFPTDCQACHNTSDWNGTTWDHDAQYFPIYSGAHNGKWSQCSECHVVPANFAVFECINCHEHRQSEVDGEHQGVNGYQYLSAACYSCHPRGRS